MKLKIKNPWAYMEDLTWNWDTTNSFWKKFIRNLFWQNTFEDRFVGDLIRAIVFSIFVNLVLGLIYYKMLQIGML